MKIENYKEINRGALLASFDLSIKEWGGMTIRRLTLFQKGSSKWITFPSQSYEKDGATKYFSYIFFEDQDIKKKLESAVLSLLEEKSSSPQVPVPQAEEQGDLPF